MYLDQGYLPVTQYLANNKMYSFWYSNKIYASCGDGIYNNIYILIEYYFKELEIATCRKKVRDFLVKGMIDVPHRLVVKFVSSL